jgi:hypothetical protein
MMWIPITTSVYNTDCGTGAGGFKKGNSCGGRKMSGVRSSSAPSQGKSLQPSSERKGWGRAYASTVPEKADLSRKVQRLGQRFTSPQSFDPVMFAAQDFDEANFTEESHEVLRLVQEGGQEAWEGTYGLIYSQDLQERQNSHRQAAAGFEKMIKAMKGITELTPEVSERLKEMEEISAIHRDAYRAISEK